MYFKLSEYRFTLGEVMDEDSDGSVMTLRNWIARDIIKVGQKHKLGRWQFNIFDIIRVRTNFSLTGMGIAPVDANAIADFVLARAHLLFSLDQQGNLNLLKNLRSGSKLGQQSLFVNIYERRVTYVDETGRKVWFKHPVDGTFTYEDELPIDDRSFLTVPIDTMIASAVIKYFKMASEEEGEYFSCEPSVDGMISLFSEMPENEKLRTMPKFSISNLLESGISQDAIEKVMKATAEYNPKQGVRATDLIQHPETVAKITAEVGSALRGADHEN